MEFDEFSDDGLDDLPDNALQELENNAISFTQAQQQQAVRKPQQQHQQQPPSQDDNPREYTDYGWDEDEDLDTSEVINRAGGPPHSRAGSAVPQPQQQNLSPRRPNATPLPNPRWTPTIDVAKRSISAMGARPGYSALGATHQSITGSQRQQSANLNRPSQSQFVRPPLPNRIIPSQQPSSQSYPNDVVSALQQRVRALEAELNAARGEVSILRTNSTTTAQQHAEEIARVKKLSSEQMQRQGRILEAAVAAEKTASTELQFLQQDMREASTNRPKRKDTGPASANTSFGNGQSGIATTPKKGSKTWGVADGFDEMEMSSPSKGQGRRNNAGSVAANVGERTPSKGKRKRSAFDSPVTALETHEYDGVALEKPSGLHQTPLPAPAHVSAPAPLFEVSSLLRVLDVDCTDHSS
jgi:hypothetical protein